MNQLAISVEIIRNATLFILGNLTTYVASYLRITVGVDVDYGDMLFLSGTIRVIEGFLTGPLGGISCKYLGFRWTCLLGGLIFR